MGVLRVESTMDVPGHIYGTWLDQRVGTWTGSVSTYRTSSRYGSRISDTQTSTSSTHGEDTPLVPWFRRDLSTTGLVSVWTETRVPRTQQSVTGVNRGRGDTKNLRRSRTDGGILGSVESSGRTRSSRYTTPS